MVMNFLTIVELEEDVMEIVMGDITKALTEEVVDEEEVVTATMGAMSPVTTEAITMEEAMKEIIPEKEVIVDTDIQTLTALNT